jgi:putative copper resistance protein D
MLAAAMSGMPLPSVDFASVKMIVGETSVGAAWLGRMAALLLALTGGLALRRRPVAALAIVTAAGGIALASLAWSGHGAMDDGTIGWVHLAADILHLLAAGIWIGALFALVLLVSRRRELVDRDHLILSHRALASFSQVGTIAVASIIVSGLINSWLLVGPANILNLPASLYGQLLITKLLLFGAMAALAATNRFKLVPDFERSLALGDHIAALGALRRSLAIETGGAIAVLALVAWLGTLEPPVSAM